MGSAIHCGMESDQRSEWNHGNAVYGINPKEKYTLARDDMQGRRAALDDIHRMLCGDVRSEATE